MKKEIKMLERKRSCPICKKSFTYFCIICHRTKLEKFDSVKSTISSVIVNINTILNYPKASYFAFFMIDFKNRIKNLATMCDVEIELVLSSEKIAIYLEDVESENVKSKKSGNILTNLIRRGRKKRGISSERYGTASSEFESPSNNSLSSFREKCEGVKLNPGYYSDKNEVNEQNKTECSDSEISSTSTIPPKSKLSFDQKFSKKFSHVRSLSSQTNEEEAEEQQEETVSVPPLAYIKRSDPCLSPSLASSLKELQDLIASQKESESNLIHLINKFIENPEVKMELVEVMTQHALLRWDVERRTNSLASEMWTQQMEIFRCQEKTLQENLFALIKQNRMLQTDNEILTRRSEKMMIRLQSIPEYVGPKMFDSNGKELASIAKNNEKQQRNIEHLTHQLETLEKELHLLQKENEMLQQSKNNYGSQLDNYKCVMQRMKTDFELERTTLKVQIKNYQQTMKESMEAGEVALQDLSKLGQQFKEMQMNVNFSKFKYRGTGIIDLIHMMRCCMNEIGREMIASRTQQLLLEKDLSAMRATNDHLQENLQKSTSELDKTSRALEDHRRLECEAKTLRDKIEELEANLNGAKGDLEVQKKTYDKIKEVNQQLSIKLDEHEKNASGNKLVVSTLSSDNCTLRNELDALRELLLRGAAGDFDKEISLAKQKIAFLQEHYCQIAEEKNLLAEKLAALDAEKHEMLQSREAFFQRMQSMQENADLLSQENRALKQKIEAMHGTIASLQCERKKYLEEKNVLKSIFIRLKEEVTRCQSLEGTVVDVSKEANRLALVAECGRKLGAQLQKELEQKDGAIAGLRESVERLNGRQMATANEKMSLTRALSEANETKERLHEDLRTRARTITELHETNKDVEARASAKLQELQKIQANNKKEMDQLLIRYWMVVQEKTDLLGRQSRIEHEVQNLKSETALRAQSYREIATKNDATDERLREISETVETLRDRKVKNLTDETVRCETSLRAIESALKQMRKEKEHLAETVEFLKNNCHKLSFDLNGARSAIKEKEQLLNVERSKFSAIEQNNLRLEKEAAILGDEKKRLTDELNRMHQTCERLLKDLEEKLTDALHKENAYKSDVINFKIAIDAYEKDLLRLNTVLKEKENENKNLLGRLESLKQENTELTLTISSTNLQTRLDELRSEKRAVEEKLFSLQLEHGKCPIRIENATKETEMLREEFDQILKQKNDDHDYFKMHLDTLAREYNERKISMNEELNFARAQLASMTEDLSTQKSEKNQLIKDCKDLSSKLMTTIQSLFNERAGKREASSKISELRATIAKMKAERECLKMQCDALTACVEEEKSKISNMERDQASCALIMDEVRVKYEHILSKIKNVDRELKGEKIDEINQTLLDEKRNSHLIELDECYETIRQLREEISLLRHQQTCLEFQKCELTLRLHEAQGNLKTAKEMYDKLKSENEVVLSLLIEMKNEGKLSVGDYDRLIETVQSSTVLKEEKSDLSNAK